jgi:hypothetical protein
MTPLEKQVIEESITAIVAALDRITVMLCVGDAAAYQTQTLTLSDRVLAEVEDSGEHGVSPRDLMRKFGTAMPTTGVAHVFLDELVARGVVQWDERRKRVYYIQTQKENT